MDGCVYMYRTTHHPTHTNPLPTQIPKTPHSPKHKQDNGVLGLQSAVLYSLPELDGAVDTVVLGGLVGDKIALVPERVRKLAQRIKGWQRLAATPAAERKVAVLLYGFPPNVGVRFSK